MFSLLAIKVVSMGLQAAAVRHKLWSLAVSWMQSGQSVVVQLHVCMQITAAACLIVFLKDN